MSPTDSSPPTEALAATYVLRRPFFEDGDGARPTVRVIADDTGRIRLQEQALEDDELLVVFDGDTLLMHDPAQAIPYTVYQAPQQHPQAYLSVKLFMPDSDDARFTEHCQRTGPKQILGRDAIGYTCGMGWLAPGESGSWRMWLDAGTGLVLDNRFWRLQSLNPTPSIDGSTFSTEPPKGARVKVVQARADRPSDAAESNGPAAQAEAELRRIAASTDRPIYYLGAEYAGLPADPLIFDNAMGSEAVGDRSLDSGQSLTIGYGEDCSGDTCGMIFEVSTDPFQPQMYRHAAGCRLLPPVRGVPAVTFGGGVVLLTADGTITVHGPDVKQATRAAAALREVGQDKPSGTDLAPPPADDLAIVEAACNKNGA